MCSPDHFRVEFAINPWMSIGSADATQARMQWDTLLTHIQRLGAAVSVIAQDKSYADMVFAADQGIRFGTNSMLLSRFRYPQRQGESGVYRQWYRESGYEVRELPEGMYFEGGGEVQPWRNMLFIGTGFRTTKDAALEVGRIVRKRVVALELVDPRFYHLDTCLMILNSDTAFYYPPAFAPKSQAELNLLIPNLQAIEDKEATNFAANSLVLDHSVVMQQGNPAMAAQIADFGYRVMPVDVGEFLKAGGGAHCLVGDLGEM